MWLELMRSLCEKSAENLGWALGKLVEELRQQRRDSRQQCRSLEAKKQRELVVRPFGDGKGGGNQVRTQGAQMLQHLDPLQTSALYLAPPRVVL